MPEVSSSHTRRNRIVAIAAGVITVVAIVLAFASEYLELPWKWIRPAAELLLLTELVGLVVLERHQLFEPVQEQVTDIHTRVEHIQEALASVDIPAISATLGLMTDHIRASSQITLCATRAEFFRVATRVAREALARDQEAPQILRQALLSGVSILDETPDLRAELQEWFNALAAYALSPGSPGDARARLWSYRGIATVATRDGLDTFVTFLPTRYEDKVNCEIKVLLRARAEALLSPVLITDREVVLSYDDETATYRWGMVLHGRQYVTLFAHWFDARWAAIPEIQLLWTHRGLNRIAADMVRRELEATESAQCRQTA
jgi:hypothetical protein